MLINILFDFKSDASGGGNNFLLSLRGYFVDRGIYSEHICNADIVLFNSHHCIESLLYAKIKYPNKLFVHRVDGPIRLYNNSNDKRDLIVNIVNKHISDGTIFQSNWSREQNLRMGILGSLFDTTIINAPDPKIFYKKKKEKLNLNRKIKLISTSWSSNMKKGFDIYSWLDRNLDFNKYDMTFIGNSPIKFSNISHKAPMDQYDLSKELRDHDIFITASEKDPCSNSLIEAMHCGLVAIALDDGGHPEIISRGGLLFNDVSVLLDVVDNAVKNYNLYQKNISLKSIKETGDQYYFFMNSIYKDKIKNKYSPKKINYVSLLKIISKVLWCKM